VGEFNLYNLLAAAAAAYALDVQPPAIQAGIAAVRQISGRMERIDLGQSFMVVVDFAHTPAALKSVLDAAREMTNGPIIVVLGSAGKRDVEKRRLMAEVAARQADLTVFTAEDPRGESLADILAMMAAGAESEGGVEGQSFWRIPDRGRAIYFGLKLAGERNGEENPLVLICGKGHEQSMNFDGTEYPWDDREATRAALDAYLKGEVMVDLGLPTFQGDEAVI
jgi:UDP-N-acetylmuramoyl-L-alanyl-D-glutamate--2,6-diaminopimelate ligase